MQPKLVSLLFVGIIIAFNALSAPTSDNIRINNDIAELRKISLSKKPLENSSEHETRKRDLLSKYNGKIYHLTTSVYNPENKSKNNLVSYDPDTETITVSLPELQKELVWIPTDGERKLKWVNHSFINTAHGEIKQRSYIGQNGFGAKVKVVEAILSSAGVAILSSGEKDGVRAEPQTFTSKVNRSKAKDILNGGRVSLILRSDLQYVSIPTSAGSDPLSLLIVKKLEAEPTISRPLHTISTEYMLPVRLISIELFDSKSNLILQGQGKEIDSFPYED